MDAPRPASGKVTAPGSLTRRRLLVVSVVFGLFVLFDLGLFGWLVLKSLSQREIEKVLLEVRRDAEPLARELEQQAEHMQQDDLFVLVSVSQVTQTYIQSVLSRREVVSKVEIRDAQGVVVWEQSSRAEDPSVRPVPRVDAGQGTPELPIPSLSAPLQQEIPIGDLGTLVIGLSEEEVQARIALLRQDLVSQVTVIAGVTLALLVLAYAAVWTTLRRARRLEEKAAEAERLAYVGTLASGLAHEIRNPLNSLNLNMQMLEEEARELGGSSGASRLFSITRSEISRLERLVTDFLSYAKPRPLERETVEVGELLQEVRQLLQAEAREHGARLDVDDDSDGVAVRVDRGQIRQLLLNLSQNAVSATAATGRPGRVTLRASRDGDRVLVEVADNGRGIPEADRERVFEVFYSTRKGGTGLGLAIVRRIARDHGATLDLESEPGVGTTVRLALPAQVEDEAA